MPRLGSYSNEIVLARPDMRSKQGRLLKQMRTELARHLGGILTAPQRALVERAAMLQLYCAVLDAKILDDTFTEHDAKPYVAFSNSLTRTLAALGMQPAAAKPAWVEPLYEALDGVTGKIAARDVWRIVGKPARYRTQADNLVMGEAMRALGWDRTMQRFGIGPVSAYVRGVATERRVPIYVFEDPVTRGIAIYRTARKRIDESALIRVLKRDA